jgi:hypothetical protein
MRQFRTAGLSLDRFAWTACLSLGRLAFVFGQRAFPWAASVVCVCVCVCAGVRVRAHLWVCERVFVCVRARARMNV